MRRFLILVCILVATEANATTADLIQTVAAVRQMMEDPSALMAQNCRANLMNVVARIEKFESKDLKRTELKTAANQIVQNLWDSRQLLRKKMIQMYQAGTLDAGCVSAIRNTFGALRFMEEYVGVHALKAGTWVNSKPQTVFSGGFPWLVGAANLQSIKFQSGDVLVSYGMAYGSAAIAHVGDDGGTFSHMAMVYVNPKGEVYTIEAHPEFGVKVAPLDKYLADGKGRSALFRHPDRELAAVAGQAIYDLAYPADSSGHPIPYDFAMDLKNHVTLFCTETASYAFETAAKKLGRPITMPMFPTRIAMKDPYIIDAFDIKERITFAPSDIEVDPQFEMIAEWRDLGRARLMHLQQAALQMEFQWLDTLDYSYRTDALTALESGVLYRARRLPLFSGLVDTLVPPNISHKALQAVVNVYVTSDMIMDKMIARDRVLEKKSRATLMTSQELLRDLEDLRESDLQGYRAYWMERNYPTGAESQGSLPSDQFSWHLRPRGEP